MNAECDRIKAKVFTFLPEKNSTLLPKRHEESFYVFLRQQKNVSLREQIHRKINRRQSFYVFLLAKNASPREQEKTLRASVSLRQDQVRDDVSSPACVIAVLDTAISRCPVIRFGGLFKRLSFFP